MTDRPSELKLGEITIAYHRGGSGPPMLLLHGFPLDRQMWQAQLDALASDHDVIAPDLRGFGDSSLSVDDVEQGVSMHLYAADAAALLTALDIREPVVLAGFSMGGYAAWQFALHHAQRLRALILCDTRAAADDPAARARRLELAAEVLEAGSAAPALGMIPKLVAPETPERQPDVVERLRAMIGRQSAEAVAAALRGMAARHDVRDQIGAIVQPALLLGGTHDAISPPEEMREIAAVMPAGRFVEIPDAGHMSPMENPSAVTDAMREFASGL